MPRGETFAEKDTRQRTLRALETIAAVLALPVLQQELDDLSHAPADSDRVRMLKKRIARERQTLSLSQTREG